MKSIKTTLIGIVLLAISSSAYSQHHLLLGTGQNMTNFRFTDDNGDMDRRYKHQYSSSYTLGYGYSLPVGVFFHSKVGMRQAGSMYYFDDFNYEWNIRYGEFRLGVGYSYDFGSIYTKFQTEGYLAYAFSATQRLFDVERDMIKAETIEPLDYGLFFAPGVGYKLSDNIAIELDVNYMWGLGNLDRDEGQITQNNLWGLNLGLNIKL